MPSRDLSNHALLDPPVICMKCLKWMKTSSRPGSSRTPCIGELKFLQRPHPFLNNFTPAFSSSNSVLQPFGFHSVWPFSLHPASATAHRLAFHGLDTSNTWNIYFVAPVASRLNKTKFLGLPISAPYLWDDLYDMLSDRVIMKVYIHWWIWLIDRS